MKAVLLCITSLIAIAFSCNTANNKTEKDRVIMQTIDSIRPKAGYADVNDIKMYYEIYGSGHPLVLLHGGGSTIQSTFGTIIPLLVAGHQVIAVELQNHGRSGFRDNPQTFEQDADDVVALLKTLGIAKANYFGFSNGGTTALQIAIRHPEMVSKLIVASAAYKRSGLIPGFFEGMKQATLDNMPAALKTAFLDVNPDSARLQVMFEKDRDRMTAFTDIKEGLIRSIQFPTLVVNADKDVITTDHALEIHRAIKGSRLAIIPGVHGQYIGEVTALNQTNDKPAFLASIIAEFLNDPT